MIPYNGPKGSAPDGVTPAGAGADPAAEPAEPAEIDIVVLANQPDVDECDVLIEALPALASGDLSARERHWIQEHTKTCGYCEREANRYQQVCSCLDEVYRSIDIGPCPIPRFLPQKPVAWYLKVSSPIGPLLVAATEDALVEIDFGKGRDEQAIHRHLAERGFQPRPLAAAAPDEAGASRQLLYRVIDQLDEYFGGQRSAFDVPLDLSGIPDFTRDVLDATTEIPFGKLDTYRGIATRIGRPGATRAVGNALNRNPIALIVPCHRIIRSDGSAGGYGGGLDIKFQLLDLEGIHLNGKSRQAPLPVG
jgi:O-6-methylguanine DNA methyltransferase